MNRNQLKLIACLSMLIDHIGYVFFPEVRLLRIIGRVAMPLFAFFIGEGCIHTRDRKKYFLRLFILALICQVVYITESIITGSGNGLYLNILFTFSCSVALCSAFLRMKKDNSLKNRIIFIASVAAFFALDYLLGYASSETKKSICLDYGIEGIILPLFAVMFEDKRKKLIAFTLGLAFVAERLYGFGALFLAAMIPALLLCFYNGEGGKRNMKYFFYLFYPLHLAMLYGVNILVNI